MFGINSKVLSFMMSLGNNPEEKIEKMVTDFIGQNTLIVINKDGKFYFQILDSEKKVLAKGGQNEFRKHLEEYSK